MSERAERVRRLYQAVILDVASEYGAEAVFELKFCSTRRWRFDAAIPELKIAIEIDGAVWARGRHTRGSGFVKDQEKFREAAMLGWSVLRFQTGDITSGVLARDVARLIGIKQSASGTKERRLSNDD